VFRHGIDKFDCHYTNKPFTKWLSIKLRDCAILAAKNKFSCKINFLGMVLMISHIFWAIVIISTLPVCADIKTASVLKQLQDQLIQGKFTFRMKFNNAKDFCITYSAGDIDEEPGVSYYASAGKLLCTEK